MSALLTILEFLGWWTLVAIGGGLILAAIMRFGLHYKPPGDLPPLPSGSLDRELAQ